MSRPARKRRASKSSRLQLVGRAAPGVRIRYCADCDEMVAPGSSAHNEHVVTEGRAAIEGVPASSAPRSVDVRDAAERDPPRARTGIAGLDRVLGGGVVTNSVTLISGDPGIGKSTIVAILAGRLAAGGADVLYVCAEETEGQVGQRARRVGASVEGVRLLSTEKVADVLREIDLTDPHVIVVDSAQRVAVDGIPGRAGQLAQVAAVTQVFKAVAKQQGRAVFLIGHVVKDGSAAGPKEMEHDVDAHLQFGRDERDWRYLRTLKNRFGPTGEIAIFEMGAHGLFEIREPAVQMLEESLGEPGVVAFPAAHLARPLLVPVEAAVGLPGGEGRGARMAMGVEMERFNLVLDGLRQFVGLDVQGRDVRVKVARVAGDDVHDGGLDLALAVAILSSATRKPPPKRCAVFGELSLSGRILPVSRPEARLEAAVAAGFRQALVPPHTRGVASLMMHPVADLGVLLDWFPVQARKT